MKHAEKEVPNRLCTKDGVLQMQDGSDVQAYLRAGPGKCAPEAVLMVRSDIVQLIQLVKDVELARMQQRVQDERFALAA
jgi:hypothetical protein